MTLFIFISWSSCCNKISEDKAKQLAEISITELCAQKNISKSLFTKYTITSENTSAKHYPWVFDYGPTSSSPSYSVRVLIDCSGEVERQELVEDKAPAQ